VSTGGGPQERNTQGGSLQCMEHRATVLKPAFLKSQGGPQPTGHTL
jgi:hypothetical protein